MLALLVRAAEVAVTVDAGVNVVLGEQASISANLFGLSAFEGFPRVVADQDYRARVLALRPGCIRFGGNLAWCASDDGDPAWYTTPAAWQRFGECLLFGSSYAYGRFAPVARQLGAEPMVSLGGVPEAWRHPGTPNPADFDRWAELCAGYVGLWKRADPQLRLVQVWNEPNADWFRDPRAKDRGTSAADLHIDMALKVAQAVKAKYPNVLVGGPVLCWPPAWPPNQTGMRPWYTWEMWTVPWLRRTGGSLDFFDFHVYGVSPEDLAVQTRMLACEAQRLQGRRLPVWISESNLDLTDTERSEPAAIWRKRILPYERLLLRGILPLADHLAGNLYHDLSAHRHTLLPGAAETPDPAYWLFWVLRDLRGLRLEATSSDPTVVVWAAMEEDRVTVVAFNDSAEPRPAEFAISMPCGYWTGPTVRAIGEGPGQACARLELSPEVVREGAVAKARVLLPAMATLAMDFRMDRFGSPRLRRMYGEHFGAGTLQFLSAETPVGIDIVVPAAALGRRAWLRLGLLGATGAENLVGTLNGVPLAVAATALQDIPLDGGRLAAQNRVQVALGQAVDNPRLAVGFAAIVTSQDEQGQP
jgi:hypothetical protein